MELNAQDSFYQGKTIRINVGYLPGDNHDPWARADGRFMAKHISGNPDFVVQSVPALEVLAKEVIDHPAG
jgi:hypothetical protein